MRWQSSLWSLGFVAATALLWVVSPYPLDWAGLSAFDPLDRICLIILTLCAAERVLSRFGPHQ